MTATAALTALALAGLGNYLLRASFITFIGDARIPHWLDRPLAHARPAILAALVASSALHRTDASPAGLAVQLGALAAAALVSWQTRSLTWTLLAGVAVLVGGELLVDLVR